MSSQCMLFYQVTYLNMIQEKLCFIDTTSRRLCIRICVQVAWYKFMLLHTTFIILISTRRDKCTKIIYIALESKVCMLCTCNLNFIIKLPFKKSHNMNTFQRLILTYIVSVHFFPKLLIFGILGTFYITNKISQFLKCPKGIWTK